MVGQKKMAGERQESSPRRSWRRRHAPPHPEEALGVLGASGFETWVNQFSYIVISHIISLISTIQTRGSYL